MTASTLLIPVAPGELIDKITILEIKRRKITAPDKLENIEREHAALSQVAMAQLPVKAFDDWRAKLLSVNEQLWDVEEALRACEDGARFDLEFVELARSVYKLNDKRAGFKRAISELCGSDFLEEKSYC